MDWLIFISCLVLLTYQVGRLKLGRIIGLKPSFIRFAFLVKILGAAAVTLIYTWYYTDRGAADIYKFFDDAVVIRSTLPEHPKLYLEFMTGLNEQDPELVEYTSRTKNWMPQSQEWLDFTQSPNYQYFTSNRIVTRINAVLLLFSGGNIFTHLLFFSWISLWAMLFLISRLRTEFQASEYTVFLLLFIPSILFWCGAPLKDTLTLAGCCVVIGIQDYRKEILLLILAVVIVTFTKYYVVIALLPYLTLDLIRRISPPKRGVSNMLFASFAGLLLVFLIGSILPSLDIVEILNGKREEALKAAIFGEARHLLFIGYVDGGILGFMTELPKSIYTALFRPSLLERPDSVVLVLAALENLGVFILLGFGLFFGIKKKAFTSAYFPVLIFLLFLALIIGYTTPVAGGLVRYKTAFIPAMIILCIPALNRLRSMLLIQRLTWIPRTNE